MELYTTIVYNLTKSIRNLDEIISIGKGNYMKKVIAKSMLAILLCFIVISQNVYVSAKSTKAEYKMKERKIEYIDDDGRVRGIISYQYPQFNGTSDSIKKINSKLRKECSKYFQSESAKNFDEYVQSAIENNSFYDKEEQYFFQTSCNLTYNKNNIVSIYMNEKWYAGGVYNQANYGFNYNLKTGKKLRINDVISGNAKEKILEAAMKYCESDTNAYNIIKNTKEDDYKFYFSKGKVYICYDSYELGRGTGWDIFSVAGKYK